MNTDAKMNESPEAPRPARAVAFWPILISALLCGLIALSVYTLYQRSRTTGSDVTQAMLDKQREGNAALQQALNEKTKLTELPPCTVREKLSLPPVTAPSTPAASVVDVPLAPPLAPSGAVPEGSPVVKPADVPPAGQASPPAGVSADVNTKIENATVFIINIGDEDSISSGTGFFIARNLILTNQHVVSNGPLLFVINSRLKAPLEARVVAAVKENGRDYAVLQVAPQDGIEPLAFSVNARRGDRVAGWGYPHAISRNDPKYTALLQGKGLVAPELVYSDGAVSSILDRTPRVIAHTAPLSHGNSGGPLTDAEGKVVGINTQISLDEDSYRQTSYSIHAEDILRFLKERQIAIPQ